MVRKSGRNQPGTGRSAAILYCILFTAVALLCSVFFMFDAVIMNRSSPVHDGGSGVLSNDRSAVSGGPIVTASSKLEGVWEPKSKYAYVTLLSGIDSTFRYRGFLYNVLIMRRALVKAGSTADFVVLVGYSDSKDISLFAQDINMLRTAGIIIYTLPRLLDDSHKLGFAEMALLKITPYSFTQYSRMQFFDGDAMPLQNMDCYFDLALNTFTIGAVSPLNSGWYLAVPSQAAYQDMKQKAVWRLGRDWDKTTGWKEPMPPGLFYRGGKEECKEWQFNGADMDQGLFLHYWVINHGSALLIDTTTKSTRLFEKGLMIEPGKELSASESLACCKGKMPTAAFAHFTGRSKPWMLEATAIRDAKPGSFLDTWKRHLDSLNLPVNSSNIASLGYGSPLGFWNAGFPKGGFKSK